MPDVSCAERIEMMGGREIPWDEPVGHEKLIVDAADRIFRSGILDEIVDDAANMRLDRRDAMDDALTIAKLALEEAC